MFNGYWNLIEGVLKMHTFYSFVRYLFENGGSFTKNHYLCNVFKRKDCT